MNKLIIISLILTLLPATWAFARDTAADEALSEDEIVERILDLQRQIDELVAELPAEARERLTRRLAATAPERAPDASAPIAVPATPVEPAPEPAAVPAPPAVAAPAAAPAPQPLRRRLTRRPHCNFLEVLDSNQDGKVSALDRYWRHLYLWSDSNGDRQVQDDEVASAYDLKVREIALDLDTFIFKKGHIGEIRVERFVTLDVGGDGLGSADDRVLVVDATKLGRGTGPRISSADDEPLAGFQPFQEGWRIEQDGAQVIVLECP
ncbi:MAG: hypothetical protein V3T72_22190 [Thermoanaerobaculia bacterium]